MWSLKRFTSAGGRNEWETFTLSAPGDSSRVDIAAVDGPVFPNKPKYPKLRVADLQVVGEVITTPGVFKVGALPSRVGAIFSEVPHLKNAYPGPKT